MPTLYDAAYLAAAAVAGPVVAFHPTLRGKIGVALRERDGRVPPRTADDRRPCVLIHGVSVGEVNAARSLVDALRRQRPDVVVVVASTTATGFARATDLYGTDPVADVYAVRWPIDTSPATRRFLDRVRPNVAVTMELEVWPNFVLHARRRGVPCIVANGRITGRSFRGYRRLGPLLRPTFGALTQVLAQEDGYAERFRRLGVPAGRVEVVPSLKFDSATVADRVKGDAEVAAEVGLKPRRFGGDETILVAGSTGPGEEVILLRAFEPLKAKHPSLRLVLVPRKPERFDEVAKLVEQRHPLTRRTAPRHLGEGIVLGDTLGELRKFYAAADLVFVGRTLVDLGEKQHGSDMIEPAALARPTVVGPFWGNFAEPMRAFLAHDAIAEVKDEAALVGQLEGWLADPAAAAVVGQRAQQIVVANRGAAETTAEVIHAHGPPPPGD